jgi:hypothetical protein
MPPFVNSLIHSLITLVSISECRSSIVAGGGAVEAKMLSITFAGCSFPPFVSLSKASCSSVKVKGSASKGCCSAEAVGLFESLLQKESRSASVVNTGDVTTEFSEEDVSSEEDDCADEGRRISRPASKLLVGPDENWTRAPFPDSSVLCLEVRAEDKINSEGGSFFFEIKEGRLSPDLFRVAKAFKAILARSSTRGISLTPLTA